MIGYSPTNVTVLLWLGSYGHKPRPSRSPPLGR